MKKIICIGECALDIRFRDGQPVGSQPGSRIANAAAILARQDLPVVMASEASLDPVGDQVVDFLHSAGVDTDTIDRYSEGRTPVNLHFEQPDGSVRITRYEQYPDEGFDIVWPRLDEGDIVVYGGYYAIDAKMRRRMSQFLTTAAERKAVMVYLPGFLPQMESRITRVMPALLENLELADLVITRSCDLSRLFGKETVADCYNHHIDYYCHSLINLEPADNTLTYYTLRQQTSVQLPAQDLTTVHPRAAIVAGIIKALYNGDITKEALDDPTPATRTALLKQA